MFHAGVAPAVPRGDLFVGAARWQRKLRAKFATTERTVSRRPHRTAYAGAL